MSTTSPDMSQTDVVVPGMRGTVVDYFTDMPVAGLTVVDGDNTTTTDANGNFELPTTGPLAPVVSGATYSTLYLPEATPAASRSRTGRSRFRRCRPSGSSSSSWAATRPRRWCRSRSCRSRRARASPAAPSPSSLPADAKVAYFTSQKLPTANSFIDGITGHRPVAVIYDLEPGVPLEVEVHTPNCTQAPPNTAYAHSSLTGKVTTAPIEPGDYNSSLVYIVE